MKKAEILSVGTELLTGQVANTNAQYLSQKLPEVGFACYYHTVVGDNPERLTKSLELSLSRSDLVIMTGGLGPTQDDLTKQTVAKVVNRKMVLDEASKKKIIEYFEKSKKPFTENNLAQSYFPEGATIFVNNHGTAPGCGIETTVNGEIKHIVMLPGPPKELIFMSEESMFDYIEKFGSGKLISRFINIVGVSESMVEEKLLPVISGKTNPTVATYVKNGVVTVRVSASSENEKEAMRLISEVFDFIVDTFGNSIISTDGKQPEEVLVALCKEKKFTFSSAESCTGGLVAEMITRVPGASSMLKSSFVTYANEAKNEILGVKKETLDKFGAVSKETAIEMCLGASKLSKSDISVSITGNAGPDTMEGKPKGLVYIGVNYKGKAEAFEFMFPGDREHVRVRSAVTAISKAIEIIKKGN